MGIAKALVSREFCDPEYRAMLQQRLNNPTLSSMSLKAPVKGGADFDPIPAGSHHAICYGVVDLGTQDGGNFGPSHKVLILWELPEERIDLEREGKRQNLPRAISQKYTLSMHKKANLRAILESWRARPFTDEEAAEFDITKLIGVNCMLTIVHATGSGKNAGRVFANVRGVSALPKGMAKRQQENPPLSFALGDFEGRTIAFPQNMPEWIQKAVMESEEYRAKTRGHHMPADADEFAASREAATDESFESAKPVRSRPAPTSDGSAFGPDDDPGSDCPF